MTEIIEYTKNDQDELRKMQHECRIWMEVIEELESMERTEEVTEAIEEAKANYKEIEDEIIRRVWKK